MSLLVIAREMWWANQERLKPDGDKQQIINGRGAKGRLVRLPHKDKGYKYVIILRKFMLSGWRERELRRCWLVELLFQVLSRFPYLLKALSASETVTGRVPKKQTFIKTA
jgi:hypothetical protein